MSKRTRWEECRDKFFSEADAGRKPAREHLKRWGANKIAMQANDALECRHKFDSKNYALGALRSVCYKAGKKNDWIDPRLFDLLDSNKDLHQYDLFRRIDACYVKFLPQRIALADAEGMPCCIL